MDFKEIIGQAEVKQNLVELITQNRLSHALLFLGKEGSGSLPLAMAFSKFIVCEKTGGKSRSNTSSIAGPSLFGELEPAPSLQESVSTEPCGICAACTKAEKLIHPDIHFSYPVVTKKSGTPPVSTDYITEWREFVNLHPYGNVYDWLQFIGAENKQGNITAHECNDIIRKLNLKSFESEYKILIMWMPEYLGNEGNKLLKLIEEPPPNTLFILVAESESQILPTILSRCQLVKIPSLENDVIEKALIERNKTGSELATQVAGISEGNYRQAMLMVQHAEEDWQHLLRDWITSMYRQNLVAQGKWVEEMSRLGREKQKQFLRYFNHLLEQAIRLKTIGNDIQIPDNERDFANRLNKISDLSQQRAIIDEIDKATYFIERNANAKLLFHALTIKVYHIIHDKIVFLAS